MHTLYKLNPRIIFKHSGRSLKISDILSMNPDPITLDILSTQSLKEVIPHIFDKIYKSMGIDNSKVLADSFKQSRFIEALDASNRQKYQFSCVNPSSYNIETLKY